MSDADHLKCADHLEYIRMLINAAREADDSDQRSIRRAKNIIRQIKKANPEFSETST